MELVTGPVTAKGPFIPDDAQILLGGIGVVSPGPIPIFLFPGFEYHITEWFDEAGERRWVMERRRAAPSKRTLKQRGPTTS